MMRIILKFCLIIILLLSFHLLRAQETCDDGGNHTGQPGCPMGDSCKSDTTGKDSIIYITAGDPNQLTGAKGYDSVLKWVSVHDVLPYTIDFENDPEIASGPAQKVIINMPISQKLNPNSLRIGSFGFGSFSFSVPPNTTTYTQRLDLRDSLGVLLDVTAGLDEVNRKAFWVFQSIDPQTGLASTLPPNVGFLPVNDTSINNGEGFVTLTLQPLADDKTRDTASEKASIIFDANDSVPTNTWVNTIDAFPPTSHINSVDTSQNIVTLHWSGQDDANGSGVRNYDLYVSDSGKAFTLYKANINATSINFAGVPNDTYSFFTVATDNTGNKEIIKNKGDVTVTIGGTILPVKWLYFSGRQQLNDVILNWGTTSEINTKEFVIERSSDGRTFIDLGTTLAYGNSLSVNSYQYIDINAMLQKTNMLYYRLREVDDDGKYIHSSVITIPIINNVSQTTVKAYPNPFSQRIYLQIITVTPTDKTNWVRLTSIAGQVVYNRKLSYTGNSTILLQDLPQLANGVYILNVSVNGKMYKVKMVKQK